MSIASVIIVGIAWLVLLLGIIWYINYGTRHGEINFLKGMGFILLCVCISGILMTVAFIVS
jgi:hypothetical protein